MKRVNIHEAKTSLSRLIKAAEEGEEVVIQRAGRAVAKLVPIIGREKPRRPGRWKGKVAIKPEFYEPLSDDELALFYGKD